ncbi:amino acid ABC transporter permease [Lentzea sp. E54]|uniref:amino acid ABC transporter permease n=1 Tax=Lentzea xerophila TaxID=3435883 RepID=UPI003DA2FBF3
MASDLHSPELRQSELTVVPLRHPWRWISGAVILLVIAGLGWSMAEAQIQWDHVPGFFTHPVMLEGLLNTIVLAVAAQGGAILLGVVIALMRLSANPVARWFAVGYIWLFRGLPVLLQILIWFNLALVFQEISIPMLFSVPTNVVMTAFVAALLGLGLNESAYMAEIVRAGLSSVDEGQTEAAKSIGMTPLTTLRRVVLPQAMRVIIPPTGNNFINMIKGTSMASVIAFLELIHAANNISSRNLEIMETLFAAAAWYLVMVSLASIGQHYLERAYGPR